MDVLTKAIDALFAQGAEHFADAASVQMLHTQSARLAAFVTEASAAFDTSGAWSASGAKTSADWIAKECKVPKRAARGEVSLGLALGDLPACAEAWRAGRIGADQARALAQLRQPQLLDALKKDEKQLVRQAERLGCEDFVKHLNYWRQAADPVGADRADEERRAERCVFLDPGFDGMWLGRMVLDPISGTIVAEELKRLEQALFEADWAEATERLGREPTVDELSRSSGQRRADALVEIATRSKMAPKDGQRPVPLFSILVGYETLRGRICELENGIVVSPGTALEYLDGATFERAVFAPKGRVEVSKQARFFTGATRRAIELRDRVCSHPYCDRPAQDCEADHIETFASGGQTTQDNGRLLCAFHNRQRNQRERPPPKKRE